MGLFHFYCKQIFNEKFCCTIIWFWSQVICSSFCCYKFDVSILFFVYFTFSIVLSNMALFINLKKSFSDSFFASVLSLLFISMYGFNQSPSLKLITLWTFFKIKPWFKACFKLFMQTTFSHLCWNLVISFLVKAFFLVKMVSCHEVYTVHWDILHQLQEYDLLCLFHHSS